MSEAKKELAKLVSKSVKAWTVSSTVDVETKCLHMGNQDEVDASVEKCMRKGEYRINADGSKSHYSDNSVRNPDLTEGHSASDIYIWSKDGNRIKMVRELVTTVDGETVSTEIVKKYWKKY